jgi:hypothetical protein
VAGTVPAGSITVTSGTPTGLTLDQSSVFNTTSSVTANIAGTTSAQAILVTNGSTLYTGSSITTQGDNVSRNAVQCIVASLGSKITSEGAIVAKLAVGVTAASQGCINLASSQLYALSTVTIGGTGAGGAANGLIMTTGSYAQITGGALSSTGNAAAQITLSDSRLDNQGGVIASNLVTTTFAATFTQPNVAAQTGAITVVATAGFVVGQTVTILNGGVYTVFAIGSGPASLNLTLVTAIGTIVGGTVPAGSITVTSGTPTGLTLDQSSAFNTTTSIISAIGATASAQAILVQNGSNCFAGTTIMAVGDGVSSGPLQQLVISTGSTVICSNQGTFRLASGTTATQGCVNLSNGMMRFALGLIIGGVGLGGGANGLIMTNSSYAVITASTFSSINNTLTQIKLSNSRLETQSTVTFSSTIASSTGLTLDQSSTFTSTGAVPVAITSTTSAQAILVTNGSTLYTGSTLSAIADGANPGPLQQIVVSAGGKIIAISTITAQFASSATTTLGQINLSNGTLIAGAGVTIGGATGGGAANGLIMSAGSYAQIVGALSSTGNAVAQITLSDSRLDTQGAVTASNLVTTTFASSFSQPAVSSPTGAITVASTTGFVVGQTVNILNGGTYTVNAIGSGPASLNLTLTAAAAAAPASTGTVAAGSITVTSGTPTGLTLDQGSQFSTTSTVTANIAGSSSTQAILVTNGSTLYTGGAITAQGDNVAVGPQQQILINKAAKIISEGAIVTKFSVSGAGGFGQINMAGGTLFCNSTVTVGGTSLGGAANGFVMTSGSYAQIASTFSSSGHAVAQITLTSSRLDSLSTVTASNLVTTTFAATFTQPTVGNQTGAITVAATAGFSVGQTVKILNGGTYTVFAIGSGPASLNLTLVTAVGTAPGGTVPAGSITVTGGSPAGLNLDQTSVFNAVSSITAAIAATSSGTAISLNNGSLLYSGGSITLTGDSVSAGPGQQLVVQTVSRVVCEGSINAQFANAGGTQSGTIVVGNTSSLVVDNNVTASNGASQGILEQQSSTISIVGTLTASNNGRFGVNSSTSQLYCNIASLLNNPTGGGSGGGLSLSTSQMSVGSTMDVSTASASVSAGGVSMDLGSILTVASVLTANTSTASNAAAIALTNGSSLFAAAITAIGDGASTGPGQQITITINSRVICAGTLNAQFASGSGTNGGIVAVATGCYFYVGGNATISNGSSHGVFVNTNSVFEVDGTLTSTNCGRFAINASRSLLYVGVGTLTNNSAGGINLVSAQFTVGVALDVSSNSANTAVACITMDQAATLIVGASIIANISTSPNTTAISLNNSSTLCCAANISAIGNGSSTGPQQQITLSNGSKLVCTGTIDARFAASSGTSAGNINVSGSYLYVNGAVTASNGAGFGLLATAGSIIELAGAITASTNGRAGISLSASQLTIQGAATMATNLQALVLINGAAATFGFTIAASQSTTIAEISVSGGSTLNVVGIITLSRTTTTIPAGIAITSSRGVFAGVAAAAAAGLSQNAINATKLSTLTIIGSSNTLSISGATTPLDVIVLDNSSAEISGITVDSAGASSSGVHFTNCASGKLTSVSATNGVNGITVDNSSRAELVTIGGTTNTGTGLIVATGGTVTFKTATMTVTGTTGNVKVGAQAVTTWANVQTGQLQYVNDWSFPAGGAAVLTSVVQSCSCTAHA